MFIRKSVVDVEKELRELRHRAERLEKELQRIELLERMQARHEIVLAKKISDINRFDDELKKIVRKEDLEVFHEQLKKLEEHETVLAENTKIMHALVNEINKVKEAHRMTKQNILDAHHVSKYDLDARFEGLKDALDDLSRIRHLHRGKVGRGELQDIRDELHDRMSQLEYQNKLLMKYLKRVDELLQQKS
ncbi:hypothetical protein JW756_06385 [Candidatus Woesearchaeota archaeon]|nr:hypothetical protein [Candidatus Woesearchaeota archaeon]